MGFIIKLIISALAVIVTAYFLPGVDVDNFWTALVVAAVLAFLNAIVKPIMILLTIPITIITLGLFLIVVNALIIMLADYIVNGFEVSGFWYALLFSLIVSFVNSIFEAILGTKKKDKD